MVDILTPSQRSFVMSKIHSKETKPEILVRKFLFSQGFRYRKMINAMQANRISFYRNIKQSCLYTAVFGMGTLAVKGISRKAIRIFGWKKSQKIANVILKMKSSWKRLVSK